jgi:hypothetical protein
MDAELIRATSARLLGHELSAARAEELAAEILPLCDAVRNARRLLEFDDETAAFLAFLEGRIS